jgi:muramoyltetrapeptide carboxypeptidase
VVALASPAPPERLERGVAALRAQGFQVVLGTHVRDRDGHHAGSPADRAADLHALVADPRVDALFCARGGSSSIRVLEHLDFDQLRARPKILVGYSDVTSVLLALLARSGWRSFFGPMVTPDWAGGLSAGAGDALWRLICRPEPAGLLVEPHEIPNAWTLVGGRAEGVLVGGTLSLVVATLGTAEQIDLTDRIFCFEDIHESPARIERYLTHLARAGVLERAAGFIVGPLRWDVPDEERGAYLTFETVIEQHLAPLGRPTLIGYPFGHVPHPVTMPLGTRVSLDADQRRVTVMEAAVG